MKIKTCGYRFLLLFGSLLLMISANDVVEDNSIIACTSPNDSNGGVSINHGILPSKDDLVLTESDSSTVAEKSPSYPQRTFWNDLKALFKWLLELIKSLFTKSVPNTTGNGGSMFRNQDDSVSLDIGEVQEEEEEEGDIVDIPILMGMVKRNDLWAIAVFFVGYLEALAYDVWRSYFLAFLQAVFGRSNF